MEKQTLEQFVESLNRLRIYSQGVAVRDDSGFRSLVAKEKQQLGVTSSSRKVIEEGTLAPFEGTRFAILIKTKGQ